MKYLGILTLAMAPFFSQAGYEIKGATITKVSLSNHSAPGVVFIRAEGGTEIDPKHSCAATSWSFAHKVEDNEISRSIYSMLLTAKATNAKVNLIGSGDCRIGYGVETLFTIAFED
ncbi:MULTISPECIES: DUF5992 family protein [Pseudoalteromonas]|uniref:Uncharacterized protein n=1 Tax=Pseudoalteromonas luteoviolacea (strain 2ta16) TaxID=1353533 RepID=V4HUZ0_PSEL2|nr:MULTISPECIES: DUF5992 family protein [Pseudoalteromonas]ESP94645.1 hypothetical protein PL2TA16_00645 [Pseudoalteromonas luteoviolacea 2ta16]KZN32344.1 hypothetical protein N483_04110 [Pseudoalteromonas luteoviolacea NCIMB 1944]MCG7547520.1 hypothetical protein [Pseudoalteromonas sp. Of7M-16]